MSFIRIQKHLSLQGLCSRREAEALIKKGCVLLNGRVVREMGVRVDPSRDIVTILPAARRNAEEKMSVIVNKPRGIVSSRERREGKTIFEILPQFQKLNVIGRLDKESEGLLLLSNDGVLARVITGEEHTVEKEYAVTVRERITPSKLRAFAKGMRLSDGPTLPARAAATGTRSFLLTLREGRKHQIRRICDMMRLTVVRLCRTRIGSIRINKLGTGASRLLTDREVSDLKNTVAK
ncbi:MAG: 23S rRNA pseudouridine synthase [Parcubacteria group bacterium Gr01-1014_72]|nr:MAG: 23S rRNA pseudouridine synthase [Parcubacteria group bacterium Gr01-1014_72]